MANTPTREHREAAIALMNTLRFLHGKYLAIDVAANDIGTISQALADTERRGYERGLKDAAAIASYGQHLAKEE